MSRVSLSSVFGKVVVREGATSSKRPVPPRGDGKGRRRRFE